MSYMLYVIYYTMLTVFIVDRPSERQMVTQKEILLLLLFFSLYSVLKTRNGWNILFFKYHYIRQYVYCVQKRKHKTCLYLLR